MAIIKNDPLTYQPSIRAFMRINKLVQGDEWPQDKYLEWLDQMMNRYEVETHTAALDDVFAWMSWLDQLEVSHG